MTQWVDSNLLSPTGVSDPRSRKDWRLSLGLGATIIWVALGLLYITNVVGWSAFVKQNAPSLGSFLEGAFAPLAFLWLVVGFFLQQRQLMENTRAVQMQYGEMRRSAEQAEIQARAIAANELHTRQDVFMKLVETVERQLGVIGGFLCMSYEPEVGESLVGDESAELWRQLGLGDPGVFSRRALLRYYQEEDKRQEFFFGSEIRERHTRRFIETFERLMAAAEEDDPRHILREALKDSGHGRLYRFMKAEAEIRDAR